MLHGWPRPDLHVCHAATANGTDNTTAQPNSALYQQSDTYHGNSDRLLRVLTLRGEDRSCLFLLCKFRETTNSM